VADRGQVVQGRDAKQEGQTLKIYSTITMQPIDALLPYARNSRTHSDEQVLQIVASMREFGFTNPVLVDEAGGVIAGHGRIMAARKLDMKEVPCIVLAGLSETQKRAYVIADNQLALNAGWDEELLALEIKDLQDMEFDLDLLGFDTTEIDQYLASADATQEGETDADESPEPPADPVSRRGDVWMLGKHRVMCGDSTSLNDAATLMGGGMADLLVTDPPYNVAYEGKTADALKIENDAMFDEEFRAFLRRAYVAADAHMRPGAAFYIWHADSEGLNFRGAAKDVGWQVRQCLVWNKNVMVMGRQDYHWKHEPCLYGWKAGAAHIWESDRKQVTVLEFNRPNRNAEHPTMKPVDLIQYQVENSSRPGNTVLDLFGGSGTTLMACERSGRINRSMELDPKYCDVIVRRWQKYTGKRATHEVTGEAFPA